MSARDEALRLLHRGLGLLEGDPSFEERLSEHALIGGAAFWTVRVYLAVATLERAAALGKDLRATAKNARRNAQSVQFVGFLELEPHVAEEAAVAAQPASAAQTRQRRFRCAWFHDPT